MSNMTQRFARIAVLHAQIVSALHNRQARDPKDYEADPTFKKPRYVVAICEGLLRECRAMGALGMTLQDVLRCDGLAAGHVDYADKLALYCVEMTENHHRENCYLTPQVTQTPVERAIPRQEG
jgi:hypothetical protein